MEGSIISINDIDDSFMINMIVDPPVRYPGSCMEETTYITERIELKNLRDLVIENIGELRGRHLTPMYLLIGKDRYSEMLHFANDRMISFSVSEEALNRRIRPRLEFAGLTVILVPWMEGSLCLPDLDRLMM